MRNISEAKRRLAANISTNIMVVCVNVGIHIWLTSYLIINLGVKVYGIIPLVLSFVEAFKIFTMSTSNTVSRFVTIHLDTC